MQTFVVHACRNGLYRSCVYPAGMGEVKESLGGHVHGRHPAATGPARQRGRNECHANAIPITTLTKSAPRGRSTLAYALWTWVRQGFCSALGPPLRLLGWQQWGRKGAQPAQMSVCGAH